LILLFIPIYSFIGAIAGGIFGFIISLIMRFFKLRTVSFLKVILLGIIFIAVGVSLAGLGGYTIVKIYVELNEPRVIYTDGRLSKSIIPEKTIIVKNEIIPFEQSEKGKEIVWNTEEVTLSFSSHQIYAVNSKGDIIFQTSLLRYDYIRELQPTEVKLFPNEKRYLVILAELRATSFHTMLLIYSPDGQIIYQEMFERDRRDVTMSVNESYYPDSGALIVRSKDGTFLYSSKPKDE
jgi:hypothetical protein